MSCTDMDQQHFLLEPSRTSTYLPTYQIISYEITDQSQQKNREWCRNPPDRLSVVVQLNFQKPPSIFSFLQPNCSQPPAKPDLGLSVAGNVKDLLMTTYSIWKDDVP